jgi:hypothetical protein
VAWAEDYLDAAHLRSALGIPDSGDDPELELAISAASRAIDDFTGRQFGQETTPVTRLYTPQRRSGRDVADIDDLMDVDELVVAVVGGDELVLGTDFRLGPANAPADHMPWTEIRADSLPAGEDSLAVTARWGWDAIPRVVEQACLIQAARLWKRKDAPFGVAGSPEVGSELRLLAKLDPDVQMLLGSVRRKWLLA